MKWDLWALNTSLQFGSVWNCRMSKRCLGWTRFQHLHWYHSKTLSLSIINNHSIDTIMVLQKDWNQVLKLHTSLSQPLILLVSCLFLLIRIFFMMGKALGWGIYWSKGLLKEIAEFSSNTELCRTLLQWCPLLRTLPYTLWGLTHKGEGSTIGAGWPWWAR